MSGTAAGGKTELRREEQYADRWTSYGKSTGIESISSRLSPEELRKFEIFAPYDDRFLARIGLDISLAVWRPGAVLFEEGTYIDIAFVIVEGEVEVALERVAARAPSAAPIFDATRTAMRPSPAEPAADSTRVAGTAVRRPDEVTFLATMDFDLGKGERRVLGAGDVFGEIGAQSGWPQSVTAVTRSRCTLLQIRAPALRALRRKSKDFKKLLDRRYRETSLASLLKRTPLFAGAPDEYLEQLKDRVELVSCDPGEVVVTEGGPADAVYLVRSGFVRLMQAFGRGEMTVSYLSKGMTFGEVELVVGELPRWETTARSVEYAELVRIPASLLAEAAERDPSVRERLWRSGVERIRDYGFSRKNIDHSEFTEVALAAGLVEGNSILAIDLDVCTRCDDCVRACAATHGGRPRFVREGDKYLNLLIAKSCYHCQDPVCLVGCPTGAIHRAGSNEVVEIQEDICIGCSTCARNCPYDSIMMHDTGEAWPDNMIPENKRGQPKTIASKCDLCSTNSHGPACVSNCPQGCAFRVSSLEEFEQILRKEP